MYTIHDLLPYNRRYVRVTTKGWHNYDGLCHVYSELNDDDELDHYIMIDSSLCIDVANIETIQEI